MIFLSVPSSTAVKMSLVLIVLSCIALALYVIYIISKWKYNYWKIKKVPHLKPTPLLGNYGDYILMKKFIGEVAQRICQAFPTEPCVGAYYGTEPVLILQDPDLIKLITTKDFIYFNGREASEYCDKETVTQSLFFSYGDRWKLSRQNMSPLFTTAKIKNMFYLVEKCAHVFEDMLDREASVSYIVEAKDLMARYTMDCICSCGFGIDTNTMGKEVGNNVFRKMGDIIFDNSFVRGFSLAARGIWPAIFYGLGRRIFPKEISVFFHKLLTGVFESRQYQPSDRHDFIDMVLNLKKSDYATCDSLMKTGDQKVSLKIDDEYLVALCVAFFAAGYETSATTLSFALYELAKNEEAQRRAIKEVDEYLRQREGKVKFDCITELPYLEACLDETLRLYPVLGILAREVMADYTLPNGMSLEKGVRIHLPVYHLHHNPEFFPEPEQFQPERFLPENKQNIKPYTYMPFGEGPRICVGMRIAKMQMLPGLLTLLKKYQLELAPGMPRTLDFDPRAKVIQSKIGLNLKLVQREGWEQRVFSK